MLNGLVSYLFRSLGVVVGISGSTALVQATLKACLFKMLPGKDVSEASWFGFCTTTLSNLHPQTQLIRRIRESLDYVNTLDPETRGTVRVAYDTALQVASFAAAVPGVITVLCSFFLKEKSLNRI